MRAAALLRRSRTRPTAAEVVRTDDFPLDAAVLDAQDFLQSVHRQHSGKEVVASAFDRTRDRAIAGAQVAPADCAAMACEGNDLLFDEELWRELASMGDLTARNDVPPPEQRARLIQRRLDLGLPRAATARCAKGEDVPNARSISAKVLPAHLVLILRPEPRPGFASRTG